MPSFSAQSVPKAPDRVRQSEGDESPGGEIAAASLDTLDPGDRHPEADSEAAEEDRGRDVAETADGGHHEGAGHGPGARPGQDDEREVVIRAEERCGETRRRRRRRARSD